MLELERLFGVAGSWVPYHSELEFAAAWCRVLAAADAHVPLDLRNQPIDVGVVIGDKQCPVWVMARTRAYHEGHTVRYGFPFHVLGMAHVVMAYIVLAYIVVVRIVMACMVMACIAMAFIVMAYIRAVYIFMAYVKLWSPEPGS